jgi:hypothetical protein
VSFDQLTGDFAKPQSQTVQPVQFSRSDATFEGFSDLGEDFLTAVAEDVSSMCYHWSCAAGDSFEVASWHRRGRSARRHTVNRGGKWSADFPESTAMVARS